MNIYSVTFEVDKKDKETDEILTHSGHFELGANAIHIASAIAVSYLDAAFGQGNYRVISISYDQDINILNWPGTFEELSKEGNVDKLLNEWLKFFGPKVVIKQ